MFNFSWQSYEDHVHYKYMYRRPAALLAAFFLAGCTQWHGAVASRASIAGPATTLSAEEHHVLRLVNEARAASRACGTKVYSAAPPLTQHSSLNAAAFGHSADMAEDRYFSHVSPDGRSPVDRIRAAGYTDFTTVGENIAAGQRTPEQVVDGWLQSPGHCANIMNPAYREIGIGHATGGSYGHYWTQNFGAR